MSGQQNLRATLNFTPHTSMIGPVAAFVQEYSSSRSLGEDISRILSAAARSVLEVILESQRWSSGSPPICMSLSETNGHIELCFQNRSGPLTKEDRERLDFLMADRGIPADRIAAVSFGPPGPTGQMIELRLTVVRKGKT